MKAAITNGTPEVARMAGKGLALEPNWERRRCVALGFTAEALSGIDLADLIDSMHLQLPRGLKLVAWESQEFNRMAWLLVAHPAFDLVPEAQRVPRISLVLSKGRRGKLAFEGVHPDWPWDEARKIAFHTGCTLEQAEAAMELEKVS